VISVLKEKDHTHAWCASMCLRNFFLCECLGFHYFHRGQTTTGRLSPNTNTEEGTLTQESGDVRSVEGEVCGAVLVDE
jgi:hypothetical protein